MSIVCLAGSTEKSHLILMWSRKLSSDLAKCPNAGHFLEVLQILSRTPVLEPVKAKTCPETVYLISHRWYQLRDARTLDRLPHP